MAKKNQSFSHFRFLDQRKFTRRMASGAGKTVKSTRNSKEISHYAHHG